MPTEAGVYWCRCDEVAPGPWNGIAAVTGEAPFLRFSARRFDRFSLAAVFTEPHSIDFGPLVQIPEFVISNCPVAV